MRDFASFLDENFEPFAKPATDRALGDEAPAPTIPFAFVAGEAAGPHGNGRSASAAAAYLGLSAGWPVAPLPPETSSDAIARELALHRIADVRSLDRLRREFAFRNHPDRVRPDWRDNAMTRMQIANRLIDEAKQRLNGKRA